MALDTSSKPEKSPLEVRLDLLENVLEGALEEVRSLRNILREMPSPGDPPQLTTKAAVQPAKSDRTSKSTTVDESPQKRMKEGGRRRSRRVDQLCPVCGRTVPMKLVTGELHGHRAPGTRDDCPGTRLQVAPPRDDPNAWELLDSRVRRGGDSTDSPGKFNEESDAYTSTDSHHGLKSRMEDRQCPKCGNMVLMRLVTGELRGHCPPGSNETCSGSYLQVETPRVDPGAWEARRSQPSGGSIERVSRVEKPASSNSTRPLSETPSTSVRAILAGTPGSGRRRP